MFLRNYTENLKKNMAGLMGNGLFIKEFDICRAKNSKIDILNKHSNILQNVRMLC